ncbi:MAG: diphthamide synthesis protein [Nanoarchaeota archaeon]
MIKTLFIPAKSKQKINSEKISEISKSLPKNLAIAYSVQYQDIAVNIKKILSETHEITNFIQVLGCSNPKLEKKTQAILLISDGKFHAVSLALATKLPVYLLSNNKLEKISETEVHNLEKRQKSAYLKYLHADKVGILVSTKPGQQNLRKAIELKNQMKNKKSYIFLSNNINTTEFENFQIDSWVNTACPRMDLNNGLVLNANKII